ncbi:putative cyclase [Paraburkholderia sp. BL27I4N3]|uniref:cyclase family protein n=1 Tax=Paraburkholderia sp. BL27I4N3 TaxID=1938805 RepID=UPI000E264F1A|nr:cyclase family protein [Paraburkholderia sp. BL27I4N3]REE07326.1 putative cyclase [Paraburkholderia sp. BL27I4N3]
MQQSISPADAARSDNPRWRQRPSGSNWGDFGPDDQRGRLNLITREKVLQGIAEVREGMTFCLSLPLDRPGGSVLNPRRHPPCNHPNERNGQPNINYQMGKDDGGLSTDVMSDDVMTLYSQYSSQWDGLAHVGSMFDADGDGISEPVYYNGYRAGEDVGPGAKTHAPDGEDKHGVPIARALGIEHMAAHGVQGRAVMIDLFAHVGRAYRPLGFDELQRIIEIDGVKIGRGDMVCLRTGFDDVILGMDKQPDADLLHHSCVGLDGRDERLLNWITESGLAVLISDNNAVEFEYKDALASRSSRIPLHEHCIFKNGIHLAELWWLSPLADWLRKHARNRFLLTAPPLRMPGAIGSPVTAVATV